MTGNLKNLGHLQLQILGQGDARLIAARDGYSAARVHLTDYRSRKRSADRLHLARAVGEVSAMMEFLETAASGNTEPDRLAEIAGEILARISP